MSHIKHIYRRFYHIINHEYSINTAIDIHIVNEVGKALICLFVKKAIQKEIKENSSLKLYHKHYTIFIQKQFLTEFGSLQGIIK